MDQRRSPFDDLRDARALEYAAAKGDLGLFVQAAWKVLEPRDELKWNWHHDYICEHLQAVYTGEIRRLIVNIYPRATKSITTSICFPAWIWANEPSFRMLFGSYAAPLATELSVKRRNLIESDWYQEGYGDKFRLASDANTKSEFSNDKTGVMKSSGMKAVPIGQGGDILVVDDPHNTKGAESDADREQVAMNFDLGWSQRLNDKRTGRIVVIMQRLHEQDLTGHLLEQGGYLHLKIPAVAEERERLVFPVTKRVITREPGDLMHPERDGPEEIERARKDLQAYGFAGQWQQAPAPKGGGKFKEDMFDLVDDLPKEFDYSFVIADTAYKGEKKNDFQCFVACGVKDGQPYVRDAWMEQLDAELVEVPARNFIGRFMGYGFRGAYIEPKGHGIYLNQALIKPGHDGDKVLPAVMLPDKETIAEFFKDRKMSKIVRADNVIPHMRGRVIRVWSKIKNIDIMMRQVFSFPRGAHDDFVDCMIDLIKLVYCGFGVGTVTDDMAEGDSTSEVASLEW